MFYFIFKILQTALTSLKDGGFILTRENTEEKLPFNTLGLDVCLDYTFNDERILLVRKVPRYVYFIYCFNYIRVN